jgi:DNA invertase Pin-like site-specific DNA recombinase
MSNVCLLTRVSSEKQDTKRQLIELTAFCKQKKFKIVRIISSNVSATKTGTNRPDLVELFAAAKKKEFKKVIVTEISRLGRKAKDIRSTIDTLHQNKISVVFKNFSGMESLDEKNNETFVTNIIISIHAELAQEERKLISERTKSGLVAARKRGSILGRPRGEEKRSVLLKRYGKLVNNLKNGLSLRQCQQLSGVCLNTVIKVKRKAGIK